MRERARAVPGGVVRRIDATCPFCGRTSSVFRATGPLLPGGLRLGEFQVLVRNEWRRRLGVQAYGRAHSEAIPHILALLAADPDAAVLRARLEEEIRCAAVDVLADGGGRDDVRMEMRQLVQAVAAVFRRVGVQAQEVREAYLDPLETAVGDMSSTAQGERQ